MWTLLMTWTLCNPLMKVLWASFHIGARYLSFSWLFSHLISNKNGVINCLPATGESRVTQANLDFHWKFQLIKIKRWQLWNYFYKQILTFLPSRILTGPSMIGIKSPMILSDFQNQPLFFITKPPFWIMGMNLLETKTKTILSKKRGSCAGAFTDPAARPREPFCLALHTSVSWF